ncbi:uncharacterized protein LOC143452839 [Clavelina lepadiformis]|uniref:uncharacterized protein LOC143452839 n=1 Tax=Clavelina lepadiformis TaxID=159417 RepID=UPI004041EBDE
MANLEVTRTPIRLGQSAITLRTQNAGYIPAISDLTYRDRTQKRTWLSYKGARPIHRTTLTLDRSKPKLDYVTLYKYHFHGNPHLQGVRRPPTCPSMFTSQWDIGENKTTDFTTQTEQMFPPKTGESVKTQRKVQQRNRYNNTHGRKMMDVTDMDTGASYVTSYRVTHDVLGRSRGPGVPHARKIPPRFNVISGETLANAVKGSSHRLRSGNRVLSQQRQRSNIYETFQLG